MSDVLIPLSSLVRPAPAARLRSTMGPHTVTLTSSCIACAVCVDVCPQQVFSVEPGRRHLAVPRSGDCLGLEACTACVEACPVPGAIAITASTSWACLGDRRWTNELLTAAHHAAEHGVMPAPLAGREAQLGDAGGGFDRLRFRFPPPGSTAGSTGTINPDDVDLRVPLNRRADGRAALSLSLPVYGGGMSYGSVSLNIMLARAMAARALGTFTCTGEGGYPEPLVPFADVVIAQIATGLFGVREETLQRAPIVEFKYAQGAKPGLGGHLLADKVSPSVAFVRDTVPGSSLFSPFPFHSVYSVEDHKKHVDWVKTVNPRALISVKVSTPDDIDMVAVGAFYAGAHIIHLDGGYGGTGAAPEIAKKNIAMPIEFAIGKTHAFLTAEGVRDQVTLIASGGLRSAHDVLKAIALGADACVIGTAELVAVECVRCGNCESGRGCPLGIATTDVHLTPLIEAAWGAQRIINLYAAWQTEWRAVLARLGLPGIAALRGRTDLLEYLP